MKLYDYVLSVNCYKQRLLLAILDVPYELVPIDFYPGWEHKGAAFRKINPLGHIPVIDDYGYILRDAHAILIYLARKYDPTGTWYPTDDPQLLGEVSSWLAFAEGTTSTASAARLHVNLGYDFDLQAAQAGAHRLFRVLDEHLWFREREGLGWVASAASATVADIALFPDVVLSEEGGISREDYPALRRWTERVQRLPRFVAMPGIFPVSAAPS
ncbi:MAG: glutathione S-transferase family protein [bacterium]|nr:glutathione S-transferase family protein [bacterium]MDE0669649.1 glutathione S-transferase family protein [bacterium]